MRQDAAPLLLPIHILGYLPAPAGFDRANHRMPNPASIAALGLIDGPLPTHPTLGHGHRSSVPP